MPLLTPDPTFYPSPTLATQSPPEKLAYVALINPHPNGRPDALGVVDVDPDSKARDMQRPTRCTAAPMESS
jgi:selenium-binding protein 1